MTENIPTGNDELLKVAQMAGEWQERFPDLALERVANRLNASGAFTKRITRQRIEEAQEYVASQERAEQEERDALGGKISDKQAAEIIGVPVAALREWVEQPPEGAPELRVIGKSVMGRVIYFGMNQVVAFGEWLADHPQVNE